MFDARSKKRNPKRSAKLITGGAGFLGSHLVDGLISRGDHVVVIDDLSTGTLTNIASAIDSGHCTYIYGDLTKMADRIPALLDEAGCGPLGQIFHLASPASPDAYKANQWSTLAVNGPVTMKLAELAVAANATFIYTSTSEIYGDPLVHPQPEHYFGNVDPIGPRSCYDEGKRFGEATVAAAVRTMSLDGRIVRFFNCYGPRMQVGDGRLIPAAFKALKDGTGFPIQGSGQQTRSMTYIEDAVAALLMVADRSDLLLKPFNIGSDDERTVENIIRTFAKVAGVEFVPIYESARPGDPQRRRPDLTFARANGWAPTTSLEEGLAKTLAWFRAEQLTTA